MYTIPPAINAITLFNSRGPVATYASLGEALNALSYAWISANVGRDFKVFSYRVEVAGWFERIYQQSPFILRDATGTAVTADQFMAFIQNQRGPRISWFKRRFPYWDGAGPVPGTGRSRHYRYYRHPQTLNERRQSCRVREDNEPSIRAARNAHNLPTSWDDYPRRGTDNDNWKRYRKTRWKCVVEHNLAASYAQQNSKR